MLNESQGKAARKAARAGAPPSTGPMQSAARNRSLRTAPETRKQASQNQQASLSNRIRAGRGDMDSTAIGITAGRRPVQMDPPALREYHHRMLKQSTYLRRP